MLYMQQHLRYIHNIKTIKSNNGVGLRPRARQATACRPSYNHYGHHQTTTPMSCSHPAAVGRCGGVADDGHTITRTATITHQACAASDCLHPRRGITHGHHHTPGMRCFRLPAVGRC